MDDPQADTCLGDLLECVEGLRPLIEDRRDDAERAGRLAPEVVSALRAQRFYSMLLPRDLGGWGAEPATAITVTEVLARIDSAVAWNVNQASAGVFMSARLGPAGTDRLFAGRDTPPVFAGAGYPPCSGHTIDDGIRVSGQVRFVSGCEDADWIFVIAVIAPAEEPPLDAEPPPPDVRVVFLPRADVSVLDTWHVMGMRATGSSDIALNDVLVPEALTASMLILGPPPRGISPSMLALFPWPVIHGEAVVSLGVAAVALETATSLVTTKVPANATQPTSERELTQANLGRARALIESARAYLDSTLARAVNAAEREGALSSEIKVSLQLAACTAAESAARAVELVYEALGSTAFFENAHIERHLRDTRVLTQHGTKSTSRYVSAGRVMLDLPPDTGVLR